MRGRAPDHGAPRRLEPVRAREGQGKPGQRRAAPAAWRTATCGQTALSTGPLTTSARRARRRRAHPASRPGSSRRPGAARTGRHRRSPPAEPGRSSAGAATNTPGRRERCGARQRHPLDAGKPLVQRRRLELAQRPHLRRRRHHPGSCRASARSSSGAGTAPNSSISRSTRLTCAWASGVSSHTQRTARAVPGSRLEDVAAGRARQVGVVEHHPRRAGGQRLLERLGHARSDPPRSSRLSRSSRGDVLDATGSCRRPGCPSRSRPPRRAPRG